MDSKIIQFINQTEVAEPKEWLTRMTTLAIEVGFPFAVLTRIDSEMAKAMLERNAKNRVPRERRVELYRSDIEHGRWHGRNGEVYIFTMEGIMDNGQHRCLAVADTEFEIDGLIVFGAEAGTELTVDQGASKTVGDFLTIKGDEYGNTISRMIKLRLGYERNDREALKDVSKVTPAEVLEYYDEHKDALHESAKLAAELQEHTRRIVAPSIVGFAHNVLSEIDPEKADAFINQVAKGEEIKEGDPAFAVRSRLLRMGKGGAAAKSELIFSGWNAFHAGRQLKTVRVSGRLPTLQ